MVVIVSSRGSETYRWHDVWARVPWTCRTGSRVIALAHVANAGSAGSRCQRPTLVCRSIVLRGWYACRFV